MRPLLIGAMCYGSTCRSPMIFGIVRDKLTALGIPAEVRSFGYLEALLLAVESREPNLKAAQPHSVRIMAERDIDITDHVPAHISQVGIEDYDFVLVADPSAYEKLIGDFGFPADKAILLDAPEGIYNPFDATVPDLLKQDLAKYRQAATQIDRVVPGAIGRYIVPLAEKLGWG